MGCRDIYEGERYKKGEGCCCLQGHASKHRHFICYSSRLRRKPTHLSRNHEVHPCDYTLWVSPFPFFSDPPSQPIHPPSNPTSLATSTLALPATDADSHLAASAPEGELTAQAVWCGDLGTPRKPALCVYGPYPSGSCPSGYRSVFWDEGCPNGKWRCCI